MSRLPNFYIIGAPKCGTTSLYEYLRGHPQVFLPEVKEPCYFAPDLAADKVGSFLVYERDRETYLALFEPAGDAPRIGEGSTRYLYSRQAPGLIQAAQPEARIVAMLRNPIDMMYSLHDHKLASGTEDIADFEEALAAEDERHAGKRLPPMSNPHLATYRDRARFGEQLERWLDVFGEDRVHVLVFEEFIKDPAKHYRGLLEFLGVDPSHRPESFAAHNVAHGTRSRRMRAVLHSRPVQWLAWRAAPRLLGEVRVHRLARAFAQSRLRRRQSSRASLSDTVRRRLEEELAPDVRQLSALLGRDLVQLWFNERSQAPAEEPLPVGSVEA